MVKSGEGASGVFFFVTNLILMCLTDGSEAPASVLLPVENTCRFYTLFHTDFQPESCPLKLHRSALNIYELSIWLIIHGLACWATVNKVTLFFIWLHSGSHVSRAHNDRTSQGDHHSSASFCSEHPFGLFSWRYTVTDSDLFPCFGSFLFFFPPFSCFKGMIQTPLLLRSQRFITDTSPCVRSSIQPGGTDASQLFAAPLVDPSAIDSKSAIDWLWVSQSLGRPVCLHMAIQSWNEP